MEIRQVQMDDPEVAPLLRGLADEYRQRYGLVDEVRSVPAHEFQPPGGAFVVLVDGGDTVAGGALRRITSQICEVKRMWTAPDRRGRGHASAVLDALEAVGRSLGYSTLRLETGWAQPEAASLYRRRGYRQIPSYGPYERATAFEHRLDEGSDRSDRRRSSPDVTG